MKFVLKRDSNRICPLCGLYIVNRDEIAEFPRRPNRNGKRYSTCPVCGQMAINPLDVTWRNKIDHRLSGRRLLF